MKIPPRTLSAVAAVGAVVCGVNALAQPPVEDAARRRIAVEKLAVLGSVLYVGAHPDDENTAMLAWLAQGAEGRAPPTSR